MIDKLQKDEEGFKVYEILAKIQQELIAPKNLRNDFGKFNYRSAENIEAALKPLLKKYKAIVYISDRLKETEGGNYIEANINLVSLEDGSQLTATAYAREERTKKGMDASQISGTASSYARKYGLNGLFLIDDVADPDSMEAEDFKASDSDKKPKIGKSKPKIKRRKK